MKVVFQWIEPCRSERLKIAQQRLLDSVRQFGLEPLIYKAGPEMIKFADILRFARENSGGDSFVWCNSDVILTRNPYEIKDRSIVHGFHRREMPSEEIDYGVDMFLVPNSVWDTLLAPNTPDLWCGATMVDCWLTRACEKAGLYKSHTGYIDHPSHPRSAASGGGDRYFKDNMREYNVWARRSGHATVDQYIKLPFLGAWNNSMRDWLTRRKIGKSLKNQQ